MKPRTLAVLAAVVASLGAWVWFWEREQPSSEERRRLERRVFRLEADQITALTVEWKGRTVRLERADVAHLPFSDDVFDAVTATCVFCSVADPVLSLREVA
ncbi:MAG: class I SAM-dependent methyltransferase, partial [Thermoanaerobaculia bacterium]